MTFEEAFDPIRSLKASWKLLTAAPAPMWVGGILMFILDGGGGGGGGGNLNLGELDRSGDVDWETVVPVAIAVGGFVCCLSLVFWVLASWIWIGFANSVEEVLRTGAGDVGRVFDSKGRLVTMMLARLLQGVLVFLSAIPMLLAVGAAAFLGSQEILEPAIAVGIGVAGGLVGFVVLCYVALGLVFVPQVVALEGLEVVGSIQRSWSIAESRRLRIFFYYFVISVFMLLGMCLCCIGIFATGTLYSISRVESYVAFTRSNELPTWWITTGQRPPAPMESWGTSAPQPPAPPPIPQ